PKARHSIHEVIAAGAQGGGGAGREARGPAPAVGVVGGVELGRGVWGVGWGEAPGVPDRARGSGGARDGARDGGGAGVLRARRGPAADAGAHHRRAAQAGAAALVKRRWPRGGGGTGALALLARIGERSRCSRGLGSAR